MLSHFPTSGVFTSLLIDDSDDDEVLVYDQLPPLPQTLESLIPPSVLSGQPRKRPILHAPMLDSPTQKLPRFEPRAAPPTLESILNGFSLSEFVAALVASPDKELEEAPIKKHDKKSRRQIISEKVRSLGRLLPCQEKKNMATMLEDAYDYIKFLEAQMQVLTSMPESSTTPSIPSGGGRLGSLTRQQVLHAVVNSPAAQALLTSEKCCIVSAEQLAILRTVLQQRLREAGF